jgi:hypothetical protein
MKTSISAIIYGIAIIVSSAFLGKAYVERSETQGKIQVTGLGKTDFVSDLIVWGGSFNVINKELKNAYAELRKNKEILKEYLKDRGIADDEIVFKAVSVNDEAKSLYSNDGKYIGQEFVGFRLTQSIEIESKQVEKLEKISREITELLNKGIQFYSETPRYFYTKLSDLKIAMISKATEDARIRAENIASFSKGKLGKLESAKMGVFQITGQNSKDSYSWGGTFNTTSKEKTASITIKLTYKTD